MNNKVLILLSTYNGEKYLKEQLESLYKQKDATIDIMIRDDGSSDNTLNIIESEQQIHHNITVIQGKNLGYAKSFWWLVQNASLEYNYYAFCDQDDIWDNEKIANAIKLLENEDNEKPLLYTSRVVSVNNDMDILSNNTFNTHNEINIYESLQKSFFPGCVFVFNQVALKHLRMYNGKIESHDWAAYTIVSMLGKTIYDSNSYIKYRIHDSNTIGKSSKIANLKKKLYRFFHKRTNYRSTFAKDIIKCYNDNIPIDYRKDVEYFAYYRNSLKNKIKLLFSSKFKGIIFKIMVLLNRV